MSAMLHPFWAVCFWMLLGVAGLVALVALVSPKAFRSLAEFGGRWRDSSKLLERFDKPIDVDRLVLPHSRALGAAVLVTLALLCVRFSGQ